MRGVAAIPYREPGSRMLPLVIAVMVYLAALSIASFGAMSAALSGWRADLASTLTVQVPARPEASLKKRIEATLAVLRTWPDIAEARPLADSELKHLLEPWLGADASLGDLPVPRLIDVDLAPGAVLDSTALAAALEKASPGVVLDANQDWVAQVARMGGLIQAVALVIIALVSLAGIAIIVFATRAGLSVHRETIEILHLMGAHDTFIAREFQNRYFRLGLLGGLFGLLITAASLSLVYPVMARTQGPWLPRLVPGLGTYLALGLLPVIAGLLAMTTARLTVLRTLGRMV